MRAGPRLTPADVARVGGKLRKYADGVKVVLLTDANCASACLNVADAVRMVPGMRHFGKVTRADSAYLDAALERLPGANKVMLPLKFWRNSLRANNEALAPKMVFDVDMADDKAFEALTLALHLAQVLDVHMTVRANVDALDATRHGPDELEREPIAK